MSYQQGLSGLSAASQDLDTIGNNVANASTIGFKEGRAEFADIYANSLATDVGSQIGIGTRIAAVAPEFTQGNIETTSNPLDIAINGQGFFQMNDAGAMSYSRDGEFQLDQNGYIVNSSGYNLMGYPVNASGTVTPTTPVPLQISTSDLAPVATSTASLGVNLDSTSTAPTNAFSTADSTSYNASTAITVYDAQGNSHTLSTYYVKTANNTWNVYGASDGTLLNSGNALGTLNFSTGGTMAASQTFNLTLPLTNGATTPQTIALTYPATGTTQYGVAFAVNTNSQNGNTTGQLSGYTIGSDGTIQGRYSNGMTRDMGQVVMANFADPQGLTALGNNQWGETSQSGQPQVGAPDSGNLGTLQSGALEQSNVDLTTQLVDMITAQRYYQANSQTIKTEDTIMQTLVNLQ
ncbi:MAG TPA: flagellar hook protein FlgE [Burkholderiaceae bacterium]|nr:flagellar hook protein FlgE [Burkholderiaceae bacterium]